MTRNGGLIAATILVVVFSSAFAEDDPNWNEPGLAQAGYNATGEQAFRLLAYEQDLRAARPPNRLVVYSDWENDHVPVELASAVYAPYYEPLTVWDEAAAQNRHALLDVDGDLAAALMRPPVTEAGFTAPVASVDHPSYLAYDPWSGPNAISVRTGYWGVSTDGSKIRTGEYQTLEAGPFLDIDGLWSDGVRSLDFYGTGLDTEASQGGLRFYGPALSADVRYERFLRRLDRDPLAGFADVAQLPGPAYVKEDVNAGQDYAMRVQMLKARFKGNLTKNIRWRLNLWGMRKSGQRQALGLGHCSNPTFTCHTQSKGQRITWETKEVEPVIETKVGPATIQYSRTMRTFSQSDQVVTRSYANFGGFISGDLPYAVVPDNYTEIDRFKVGVDLGTHTDFYANFYNGNTLNRFRRTNRRFRGFDTRLTDTSIDGVTLTGYAKKYVQTGQTPPGLLPEETAGDIRQPFQYDRTTAGIKARWRPFDGLYSRWSGFALSTGYEFEGLARDYAVFSENGTTVDQSSTPTHWLNFRASMRWSRALDSFVEYRAGFIDDPLFGLSSNGVSTNTALPTQSQLVEIGNTWTPVDSFLVSSRFGLNNNWNQSDEARFREDDYPITLTAWYTPTERWSVTGGLAFLSNWVNQDITLGSIAGNVPVTESWAYRGRSDVVNIGTTYAWSDLLTLIGSFEFVRGFNGFASPATWSDLNQYSEVRVETTRWSAGFDYLLGAQASCYLRYQYFDFADGTQAWNSGTSHLLLGGVDAVF